MADEPKAAFDLFDFKYGSLIRSVDRPPASSPSPMADEAIADHDPSSPDHHFMEDGSVYVSQPCLICTTKKILEEQEALDELVAHGMTDKADGAARKFMQGEQKRRKNTRMESAVSKLAWKVAKIEKAIDVFFNTPEWAVVKGVPEVEKVVESERSFEVYLKTPKEWVVNKILEEAKPDATPEELQKMADEAVQKMAGEADGAVRGVVWDRIARQVMKNGAELATFKNEVEGRLDALEKHFYTKLPAWSAERDGTHTKPDALQDYEDWVNLLWKEVYEIVKDQEDVFPGWAINRIVTHEGAFVDDEKYVRFEFEPCRDLMGSRAVSLFRDGEEKYKAARDLVAELCEREDRKPMWRVTAVQKSDEGTGQKTTTYDYTHLYPLPNSSVAKKTLTQEGN